MSAGFGFDFKDSGGAAHHVFFVETTAKGDLIIGTGNTAQATDRLPVGADGDLLMTDSTAPLGVRWITGGVTGSFGG